MNDAAYRSPHDLTAERLAEARAALEELRAMPTLRRALLPPDTARDLVAIEEAIAREVEGPASPNVAASLDEHLAQLAAIRARAESEINRVGWQSRHVEPPPPPSDISVLGSLFSSNHVVSIEHAFRAELGDEAWIRPHGAGFLAELARDRCPLAVTARARRSSFSLGSRRIDCRLRASAPHGFEVTVDPRWPFGFLFGPGEAIDRDLDRHFVTRGPRDIAAALLDLPVRRSLITMRYARPRVQVGGGIVELSWTGGLPILDANAVRIVTSIARRLYGGS